MTLDEQLRLSADPIAWRKAEALSRDTARRRIVGRMVPLGPAGKPEAALVNVLMPRVKPSRLSITRPRRPAPRRASRPPVLHQIAKFRRDHNV
jgi:hypothetical protein